tara:strand:+ start:5490 stop:6158 length:669 start_codon:yes stop_codon:yes gene_type:complete
MKNLTLIVPAKKEKESLPIVLNELKDYDCKILIVLDKNDHETIDSIKNYDCKILYQASKGYGDALINGIKNLDTEFFCIFNADGSFNPIELKGMYDKIRQNDIDLIFASRYEKDCSSEDDTIITKIGNFIFTKIGNIIFKLKITDILYTYVMGKSEKAKILNLKSKDFSFCVELPIKANKKNYKLSTSKSNERSRIGGKKKVNAIKDGALILISMFKLFFQS